MKMGLMSVIAVVVHADDIFAMGRESRCDRCCEDLNKLLPIDNLGKLRWYICSMSFFPKTRENDSLTHFTEGVHRQVRDEVWYRL